MTDRHFRLLLGIALLVLLYLDNITGMGVLIVYLVFEAVTNWRAPLFISQYFQGHEGNACGLQTLNVSAPVSTSFEAEHALTLINSGKGWL